MKKTTHSRPVETRRPQTVRPGVVLLATLLAVPTATLLVPAAQAGVGDDAVHTVVAVALCGLILLDGEVANARNGNYLGRPVVRGLIADMSPGGSYYGLIAAVAGAAQSAWALADGFVIQGLTAIDGGVSGVVAFGTALVADVKCLVGRTIHDTYHVVSCYFPSHNLVVDWAFGTSRSIGLSPLRVPPPTTPPISTYCV